MTISLVANIGTSDLSIQIDGYFLPIAPFEFPDKTDADAYEGLTEVEKEVWKNSRNIMYSTTGLYSQLELKLEQDNKGKTTASFLEITKKLWESYEQWRDLIACSRLSSVIYAAKQEFNASKFYIFATHQIKDHPPDGFRSDTYYLAKILERWFAEQDIKLTLEVIDLNIKDTDRMLAYYHEFFDRLQLTESDTLLISTRAGTEQMINGLRLEAVSSQARFKVFLEPELRGVVKNILNGQPSHCKKTFYWRSLQRQKYATAKLLLEKRWDFDGARVILNEWQESVKFLQDKLGGDEIQADSDNLKAVLSDIDYAIGCLNLFQVQNKDGGDINCWLNLYTQCRIYWNLDEVSNFLPRLGSFCEEVINQIIRDLGGERFFYDNNKDEKWSLSYRDLEKKSPEILAHFQQYEKALGGFDVTWRHKKRNHSLKPQKPIPTTQGLPKNEYILSLTGEFGAESEEAINDLTEALGEASFKPRKSYKLKTRHQKRNFARALMLSREDQSKQDIWLEIESSIQKLNYWIDKRNDLIHSAKGLSKKTMQEQLMRDRNNWSAEDEADKFKASPHAACLPDEILDQMSLIAQKTCELLNRKQFLSFIGYNSPHYLYSEIKQNIFNLLT